MDPPDAHREAHCMVPRSPLGALHGAQGRNILVWAEFFFSPYFQFFHLPERGGHPHRPPDWSNNHSLYFLNGCSPLWPTA